MSYKKVFLFVVLIGVIFEIVFLTFYSKSSQSQILRFPGNSTNTSQTLGQLEPTYKGFSKDNSTVIFGGTLKNIYTKNNTVFADVEVTPVDKKVLVTFTLFPSSDKTLIVAKQNVPDPLPITANTSESIYNSSTIIATLKPYLNTVAYFTVVTIPTSAPKAFMDAIKKEQTGYSDCDSKFINFMNGVNNKISCQPLIYKISVYEKNL